MRKEIIFGSGMYFITLHGNKYTYLVHLRSNLKKDRFDGYLNFENFDGCF